MNSSVPVHTDAPSTGFFRWPVFVMLAVLAFAWLRLILHLRVVWTVDEQYAYGWAVPFLCAVLFWRRWAGGTTGQQDHGTTGPTSPVVPWSRGPMLPLCCGLVVLAFLATRLVEEANPDWRLVSWALALEVTGLSLVFLFLSGGARALRQFAFPILFFLVAVPWPTPLEQPLIQLLTRSIVAVTVELLNALGFPALTHGNVIETAGGFVDVDEACSGIRSLQAALMLALFFGEWRRLNVSRRVALLGVSFALACVFNLARTLTLALVATKQGSAAVARWHDPAGVTILLGCFCGVWAAATWLAQKNLPQRRRDAEGAEKNEVKSFSALCASAPLRLCGKSVFIISTALLLLAGELAIRLWYASAPRVVTAEWRAEFPRSESSFKTVGLPSAAREILRYDEGESASWRQADGTRWQMIYLRWEPGRTATTLARNHTPEICLPAAGKNLRDISDVPRVEAAGLSLPFRCYTTEQGGRPLFVFYSLWEDGVAEQRNVTELLTRRARLDAVRERRRNPGQRVLQIGLWGARDAAHAEELLRAQLPKLIHSQKTETLKN